MYIYNLCMYLCIYIMKIPYENRYQLDYFHALSGKFVFAIPKSYTTPIDDCVEYGIKHFFTVLKKSANQINRNSL